MPESGTRKLTCNVHIYTFLQTFIVSLSHQDSKQIIHCESVQGRTGASNVILGDDVTHK